MYGEDCIVIATAVPAALNLMPSTRDPSAVPGFANFVPKPEPDQPYTCAYGLAEEPTASAVPLGLKAHPYPPPGIAVTGSENFVPNPDPDHGYAVM
jgi:hypothetical protein